MSNAGSRPSTLGSITNAKPQPTDLAELEQQIRDALDLLQGAQDAYEKATDVIRKQQLNRALFARMLDTKDQLTRACRGESVEALVTPGRRFAKACASEQSEAHETHDL